MSYYYCEEEIERIRGSVLGKDETIIFRQFKMLWEQGVNVTAFRALLHIDQFGPMSSTAIATLVGISTGAMTGTGDQLERQGYIDKKKDDKDRRVLLLSLTEAGQKFLSDFKEIRSEYKKGPW